MSDPLFIDTLEELDGALHHAAAARLQSDDAFREALSSVIFRPAQLLGRVPSDPSSNEYRSVQLRLYEQLTQSTYDVVKEETQFDRAHMLRWPFPYVTRSATTVGNYLMMYGDLIKEMSLPAGAHILEMGSGYGSLTYQLASMGYRVTCADISEKLLEYVRTRCAGLPGAVDTIQCDMNDFSITGVYDAVIFFESFHHVLNHADLVRRMALCLQDNGILVFAGEPIVASDSQIVPYPWGLRMDGLSLWAIRRQGWLELGFRFDYFNGLLSRSGWSHRRVPSVSIPGIDTWICRQTNRTVGGRANAGELIHTWRAIDSAILTQCGYRDLLKGTLRSQGQAGYLSYGPYLKLDTGIYEIAWEGTTDGDVSAAVAEVACNKGQLLLCEVRIGASLDVLARTRFFIKQLVEDIEFRIRVGPAGAVELKCIELRIVQQPESVDSHRLETCRTTK